MGLSLDNAISLLANLELYGMNSTTVVTAMRTAVKNFSADGLDAQTALQSTITEIANMENAADATALAIDTFGSRAGVDMANAIRSGAISIETLTGNLDVAQGTLSSTARQHRPSTRNGSPGKQEHQFGIHDDGTAYGR